MRAEYRPAARRRLRLRRGWSFPGREKPGPSAGESPEPVGGSGDGLGLFREAKTNPLGAGLRVREEAGAGHGSDSDLSNHVITETYIVEIEIPDICHYVVSALRIRTNEPNGLQSFQYGTLLLFVSSSQIGIV